ncbi:MAG: hypothetical protein JSS62_00095 [Verrucomicrobia bacterium]|nr:hypothetical protein [Verrucomicrobiota bacterium]MBS0646536.1 hypothetical protein [Verrucomicrobiota bacterium]
MNATQLQQRIAKYLSLKIELRVNNNRSTMLNILQRQRQAVKLSIHKMFLDAPEDVIVAVAHYVKGTPREKGNLNHVLRTYIQNNVGSHVPSTRLNEKVLIPQGKHYDLQKIYETLNGQYFQDRLNLKITWYGTARSCHRPQRLTFGLYQESLKLIKIHQMLDDPFFPSYFVWYIVYHEMVHNVVPGKMDARGRFCVHSAAFKEEERKFIDYERAITWERQNKEKIFRRGWA